MERVWCIATDSDYVCKIYEGSKLTDAMEQKIQLMLRGPIQQTGICWPQSTAMNERGEFVGYLMERARGKELQKTVFIKPLLQAIFPSWTRIELVTLTISILRMIQTLHERNVIIGDINPLNILVADESTVFFVDTDSYQIEDFACPVGDRL